MAAREYTYARRVWHRPSDGGCYAICRSLGPGAAALAAAGAAAEAAGARRGGARPSRSVAVQDYVSAVVLRAVPEGTEIVQVYYEDSGVSRGQSGRSGWPCAAAGRLVCAARPATRALIPAA